MKLVSQVRFLFLFIILVVAPFKRAIAQELDCTVELNVSALPEQERLTWENFKSDLSNYINNNTWTSNFSGERIHGSFQLNIVSRNGSAYGAQLFVTSSRPLYKTEQVTTMARFFDDKLEFTYERGSVLQHGNSYRSLESVIDFYVYIIIGLDYDSYQRQSGTPFFQQAHETAVVASAAGGKGWDQTMSSMGTYSRLGYIEDVLNANLRAFRDVMWEYNYQVLDLQSTKPDQARVNLANVVDTLVLLKRQSMQAQRSVFLRTFFESKYSELADLGRYFPDNLDAYFQKLVYLDGLHQTYYENIRQKLRQ